MRVRDLTITATQLDLLRRECNVGGDLEGACQLLCGSSDLHEDPWADRHRGTEPELRLTVHRTEPLPPDRVRAGKIAVR